MTFSWLFKIVLLIFLVSFTIFLKIKDFHNFIDPEAFLVTADAFRFARYAIEIQNETYGKIDYLANIPDFGINQYPPPLLSLITAWLSNISGIQIHYFFLLLPPLLSVLVVIPLCLWLKPLDNDYVTFGAITMTLFNFFYYVRTRAGYFDTDCMMLFFIFIVVFFITKGVSEKENQIMSYLYIILAALIAVLFRWWYDHLFFVFIFSASLLLGLIAYRNSIKDVLIKIFFFLLFFNPIDVFFYILNSPFLKDYVYGVLLGIERYKMPIDGYAPISELIPFGLGMTINLTTDNKVSFWLAVFFGIVLYAKNWKYFSPSFPVLFLALMSFFAGNRYLMYLGPFIGMGFGFGIYLMVSFIKRYFSSTNQKILHCVGLLFLIVSLIPSSIINFKTRPLYIDETASNLKKMKDITEPHAYIWSWWGMGNLIQYYSNRAVYVDNIHFDPLKLYIILKSFTTKDEDFMYRAISFLTNNKKNEYEDFRNNLTLLSNKIKDYNLATENPVYVYLHNNMLDRSILKNNTLSKEEIDIMTKTLPEKIRVCALVDNNKVDCNGFIIDKINKKVTISDKTIEKDYKKIVFIDMSNYVKQTVVLNENAENVIYVTSLNNNIVHNIIGHEEIEYTMLFKMFVEQKNNFSHFELVYKNYPHIVVYKVKK